MKKIIDIHVKAELPGLPFGRKQASELMEYIMRYKLGEEIVPYSDEEFLIKAVINFIENNSGVTKEEVFSKMFKGA